MEKKDKELLFGKIALKLGYINEKDIKSVLEDQAIDEELGQQKPIGAYLFETGKLSREQIKNILAFQKKVIEKKQKL